MADQESSQIDDTTMRCRVCGHKASGLNYGVHSCEKCRRFFKRCIKHGSQYKPCKNSQLCSIVWYNRNKCNSCHLKKCIAVGMYKEAPKCEKSKTLTEKPNIHATKKKAKVPDNEMQKVLSAMQKMRISKCGKYKITAAMKKMNILEHKKSKISPSIKKVNIPEREKSTILDGMQDVNAPKLKNPKILASIQTMETNSPDEDISAEIEEEFKLTASTNKAHEDACDLAKENVAALSEKVRTYPNETNSPDEDISAEIEEEFNLTASTNKAHENACDLTREKVEALSEKVQTYPNETNSPYEDLSAELDAEFNLTTSTNKAHENACDLPKEKVEALSEKVRTHLSKSFSQLVCPLIAPPYHENGGATYSQKEHFERLVTVINGVLQFCKSIPCFKSLSQWDQDVLLKAGLFEVLLVRLATRQYSHDDSLLCFNGLFLLKDSVQTDRDEEFLYKSLCDFAERMNQLRLSSTEVNLFSWILLVAADHPGLRNTAQVRKVQNKLIDNLHCSLSSNHTENPNVFNDLMKMIPTVRILNCLHSKKLMTYEMEAGREPETVSQIVERIFNEIMKENENSSTHLEPSIMNRTENSYTHLEHPSLMNGKENSSTHLEHPSQRNLVDHPSIVPSEEENNSPGRQSDSSTISYELSTKTDSISGEKLDPMCVEDSNSSLQISSSSSSGSHIHEDPGLSETNLVHELRFSKMDESDNEVMSEGEFFDPQYHKTSY